MVAEHRNATEAAVRIAGQTADTRRNSMAVPMDVRVAVGIRHDRTAADLMSDRVTVAAIEEVAVLRIADPAVAEAAGIVVAVAVVVRAAAKVVALRIRLLHAVVAEGLIGKVEGFQPAEPFRSQPTGALFGVRFKTPSLGSAR